MYTIACYINRLVSHQSKGYYLESSTKKIKSPNLEPFRPSRREKMSQDTKYSTQGLTADYQIGEKPREICVKWQECCESTRPKSCFLRSKMVVHLVYLGEEYKRKSGADYRDGAPWLFYFISQMEFFYCCTICLTSEMSCRH